ncbi:MAG: hypothetical protein LBH07_00370 [Treponema sp.]|jgi:hypothetical protein|nr:hypothetical protein [Treponema sp.]
MTIGAGILFFLFFLSFQAQAESVRALIAGTHRVSLAEPEGITISLSSASSSIIQLEGDTRFFRGIELELTAPQNFLSHRGNFAVALYGELDQVPRPGTAELEGRRLAFDQLPAKIQTIYQIPLIAGHGFRTTPYATVLTGVISQLSFPLLFRLMPVVRGVPAEVESMVFSLNVKPILNNEGALKINFRYPANLLNRPFTVLLDNEPVENPGREMLLREGEHQLAIVSEDYRNKNVRFIIERAKTLDLMVELMDTTPLLVFEYPENARIFLNNTYLPNPKLPQPVAPGQHEIRFHVGDYTVIRSITVQKGKTYRLALSVDVNITENE